MQMLNLWLDFVGICVQVCILTAYLSFIRNDLMVLSILLYVKSVFVPKKRTISVPNADNNIF